MFTWYKVSLDNVIDLVDILSLSFPLRSQKSWSHRDFHAGELTWASLPALLGQPEKKTESTRAFQAPFVPHLLMSSWPKQVTCQAHISLGE